MPASADERRRGLRGVLTAEQYRLLERAVLGHGPHLIPLLTHDADALTADDLAGLRRAVDDERAVSGLGAETGSRREAVFEALADALSSQRWERRA